MSAAALGSLGHIQQNVATVRTKLKGDLKSIEVCEKDGPGCSHGLQMQAKCKWTLPRRTAILYLDCPAQPSFHASSFFFFIKCIKKWDGTFMPFGKSSQKLLCPKHVFCYCLREASEVSYALEYNTKGSYLILISRNVFS
jgi:hypothetical protein